MGWACYGLVGRSPELTAQIVLQGGRQASGGYTAKDEIEIAAVGLQMLDDRLGSVRAVAIELGDKAEFEGDGRHAVVPAGKQQIVLPRAAAHRFAGVNV